MSIYICDQCGEDCEEIPEGVCPDCCQQNNEALFMNNHEFDMWERLDNERRDQLIKDSR